MIKISNYTAELILDDPHRFMELVLVSFAGDWLLMTRSEFDKWLVSDAGNAAGLRV